MKVIYLSPWLMAKERVVFFFSWVITMTRFVFPFILWTFRKNRKTGHLPLIYLEWRHKSRLCNWHWQFYSWFNVEVENCIPKEYLHLKHKHSKVFKDISLLYLNILDSHASWINFIFSMLMNTCLMSTKL